VNIPARSSTHLVLIPSFNSGGKLVETVREALREWAPVWVVLDGCTDGSRERLAGVEADERRFRVLSLDHNQGKGAAVYHALIQALEAGFEYVLVMDADGQHPADFIRKFMELSAANPGAMILGEPEFGPEAPLSRRKGRCVGNWWTHLATLWGGVHDSLFGFRVYPIRDMVEIFQSIRGGRRFDFETQMVIRLYWRGIRPINVMTPVKYFNTSEGGVTHFRYLRDNLLLIRVHTCLFFGMLARFRSLWRMRKR
jgi:glycosyltransferase involved in cell wall biosynthesis